MLTEPFQEWRATSVSDNRLDHTIKTLVSKPEKKIRTYTRESMFSTKIRKEYDITVKIKTAVFSSLNLWPQLFKERIALSTG